jgi:hypothetical protein
MTTPSAFRLLLQATGLSLRAAAAFLGVRYDSVESWSQDRRRAPPGAIDQLRALYRTQLRTVAEAGLLQAEQAAIHGAGHPLEVGAVSDDHEAQSLGWPSTGAQHMVVAMVVAQAEGPVRVVPRGATLLSAAAADQNDAVRPPAPAPSPAAPRPRRAAG